MELKQVIKGYSKGEEKISLDFQAYLRADSRDEIEIKGDPPIHLVIRPCVHGDRGTVAVVINSIPLLLRAKPGFLTMRDIQLPHITTS